MATKRTNQTRYGRMRAMVLSASILSLLPLVGLMHAGSQSVAVDPSAESQTTADATGTTLALASHSTQPQASTTHTRTHAS